MKRDALNELDYDAFANAVLDVLEDEPEGLWSVELFSKLGEHHWAPPMKYFHVQLAELKRGSDLVIDHPNNRYLHPKHADEDPESHLPRV